MRRIAVFIPEELLAGLKALKAEHGTPEAESIRRAIAAYFAAKGVNAMPKPRRRPKKLLERKRTAAVLIARRRSTVQTRRRLDRNRTGGDSYTESGAKKRRAALEAQLAKLKSQLEAAK